MPEVELNGASLHYELHGEGKGLVLVHGSWADHHTWDLVAPLLAERFRVLSYDRRGHSESGGTGSIDVDVVDLEALIEQFDLGPAHVVANSRGGAVALRLALARPELIHSLSVHEPPLFALLPNDTESRAVVEAVNGRIAEVVARLEAGDEEAGARLFMDEVAIGEGAWDAFPPDIRTALVANAGTFLEEERDPTVYMLDLEALGDLAVPVLLTYGDQSPRHLAPVLDRLESTLPDAERRAFEGAGHLPQLSHADDFVKTTIAFAERS